MRQLDGIRHGNELRATDGRIRRGLYQSLGVIVLAARPLDRFATRLMILRRGGIRREGQDVSGISEIKARNWYRSPNAIRSPTRGGGLYRLADGRRLHGLPNSSRLPDNPSSLRCSRSTVTADHGLPI